MDMDMDEGKLPGAGGAAIAEDAMSRFSLDASAGGRHSTLLDEYERLAFEAQLNRAIVLRRCYSEPSPVRLSAEHQRCPPPGDGSDARAATASWPRGAPDDLQGEAAARRHGPSGRFWRLHEVLARGFEALRPVTLWLRSAWECRWWRKQPVDDAARRPPATVPRVQLMDYLR